MSEINDILNDYRRNADRITTHDDGQEYSIVGYKDVPVPVPYSSLSDPSGRCATLERLLRKNVPGDTILAFIEQAKHDGRWG